MGTDIHTNIEVFNKKTDKWERKALYYKDDDGNFKEAWTVLDDRNYDLFGKLAGVRTIGEPFVYPRGLPDNLSNETKELYGDASWCHDETWYDYCELHLYSQTCNVVKPFIDAIDVVLEAYSIYYPDPGDVRIVMWFDS